MKVIDNTGKTIEVTDLNAAIRQQEQMMGYSMEGEEWGELNRRMKAYHKDLYEKLLKLKTKKTNNNL